MSLKSDPIILNIVSVGIMEYIIIKKKSCGSSCKKVIRILKNIFLKTELIISEKKKLEILLRKGFRYFFI